MQAGRERVKDGAGVSSLDEWCTVLPLTQRSHTSGRAELWVKIMNFLEFHTSIEREMFKTPLGTTCLKYNRED